MFTFTHDFVFTEEEKVTFGGFSTGGAPVAVRLYALRRQKKLGGGGWRNLKGSDNDMYGTRTAARRLDARRTVSMSVTMFREENIVKDQGVIWHHMPTRVKFFPQTPFRFVGRCFDFRHGTVMGPRPLPASSNCVRVPDRVTPLSPACPKTTTFGYVWGSRAAPLRLFASHG